MFLVEVLERGATEDHVVFELYELQSLADREATPLLEHTVSQKELPQGRVDLSLETISAVQNAPIDVLAFPLEHPSVRVVDCVQPDEKRVRDLAISFALLPPFKDAFRLPCRDFAVLTRDNAQSLFSLSWRRRWFVKLLLQAQQLLVTEVARLHRLEKHFCRFFLRLTAGPGHLIFLSKL
jgi:hypothetical protein